MRVLKMTFLLLALAALVLPVQAHHNPNYGYVVHNNTGGVPCEIYFEWTDDQGISHRFDINGMVSSTGPRQWMDPDYDGLTSPLTNQYGQAFNVLSPSQFETTYQICCNGSVYEIRIEVQPGIGQHFGIIRVYIDPVPELGCETDPHG